MIWELLDSTGSPSGRKKSDPFHQKPVKVSIFARTQRGETLTDELLLFPALSIRRPYEANLYKLNGM